MRILVNKTEFSRISGGIMKRRKIGLALIILGVLAWPFGLFVLNLEKHETLAIHLSLVLPGVYLRGLKYLRKR